MCGGYCYLVVDNNGPAATISNLLIRDGPTADAAPSLLM